MVDKGSKYHEFPCSQFVGHSCFPLFPTLLIGNHNVGNYSFLLFGKRHRNQLVSTPPTIEGIPHSETPEPHRSSDSEIEMAKWTESYCGVAQEGERPNLHIGDNTRAELTVSSVPPYGAPWFQRQTFLRCCPGNRAVSNVSIVRGVCYFVRQNL